MASEIKAQYRSKTPEQAVAHLAEEASELAAACAKTLRWGPYSYNPELPPEQRQSNLAWMCAEMRDVLRAWDKLAQMLMQEDVGYLPSTDEPLFQDCLAARAAMVDLPNGVATGKEE